MAKKTKPRKSQPKSKKSPPKSKKKQRSKKGILITFIIIAVVVAAGVFYLLSNLNMIIKMAIEKYGSEATKTAVRVSSVKISLKDGSGAIHGLTVANPRGFDTRHAFSLGEISTRIDIKSLTKDIKVIDDITLRAPEIFVEVNKDNKNNLNEIQKNLPATPYNELKPKQRKINQEPRLIIRHFHFSEGLIQARIVPLNKEYQLKLPPFEMRNIGGQTGATPAQIAKQVVGELIHRALAEVKKKGLDQAVGKVKEKITSKLGSEGQKAKDKTKGLLK